MKILSVVGARPQFIKLKPLHEAISRRGLEHYVVHTGQHYDSNMSEVFFRELGVPDPNLNLGVGSGTHGRQTGEMLAGLEDVMANYKPNWVLVYGDTNSTLAGALAAAKLGTPIGHVESGLRSRNRAMPEEINRVVTDHLADRLFAPTELAMQNLKAEGLASRAIISGDVMADLLISATSIIDRIDLRKSIPNFGSEKYLVLTIHRASNTDSKNQLARILSRIAALPFHVYLVAHPRLVLSAKNHELSLEHANIQLVTPLGYFEMIKLVKFSEGVITDSGGLQKESFILKVPCITLRSESEWPETFSGSMNVLSPDASDIEKLLSRKVHFGTPSPFGYGDAAEKIISSLVSG